MKLFFFVFFFFFNVAAHALGPERIVVQLQWKHQFEFAGFYAAKERGFYEEVGLDVEFLEYKTDTAIVDQVLSGRAQYGVGYSSVIADFYNDKPIVMLANFFKHSPLVLVAQKDIATPAELRGKTIMGISDNIDSIVLVNMLGKFGIEANDYKNIPTDFQVDKFVLKQVDAMSVFTTNEIYKLDKLQIQYNVFNPAVFGQEYYDCNLFTTVEEVLSNPHRVKAFTKATIKGWEYALAHKEELSELILQKYNSQGKSKEALLFEAKQIEQLMLKNVYPIGMIDKMRVQMIADEFKQAGFIKDTTSKSLDQFIFIDDDEMPGISTIKNYINYINPSYVWQLIAFLAIGLVLVLWRNHIAKKLNLELQDKIERAIKETREKDKMLFHQNKLASMGEMMQNIAHQWRQPLSQINSAVLVIDDVLEDKNLKDDLVERKLLEIETLTNYMSKTISDFKEFYSPAKHKNIFIIQELIQEAEVIVDGTLKSEGIDVVYNESESYSYYSFKNELKQAVVIIFNNAIEAFSHIYGEDKKIVVSVTFEDACYVIKICDNAGGIDESIIDKIFEPYFTTKHMLQGTGLGLYIAKLIVEESVMGSLSVENIEDGACFSIRLKEKNE